MIGWLLLVWSIAGALLTAVVSKSDPDKDGYINWHFEWQFRRDDWGRIIAAGPLIWLMIVIKGL